MLSFVLKNCIVAHINQQVATSAFVVQCGMDLMILCQKIVLAFPQTFDQCYSSLAKSNGTKTVIPGAVCRTIVGGLGASKDCIIIECPINNRIQFMIVHQQHTF